jgi:hypothetical protein
MDAVDVYPGAGQQATGALCAGATGGTKFTFTL